MLTQMIAEMRKYGVVGIINNLLGYLIYLLLTWFWIDPKMVVTFMYPIGVVTAYYGHARYSFSYNGTHLRGIARYLIVHLIGYATNVGMLYLFWNRLGYPHQLVQAVAIFVVAFILFFLCRYFVFPKRLGYS